MAWLPKSRKARRRLYIVAAAAPLLAAAVGLSLYAMQAQVTFFYAPGDLLTHPAPVGRDVRLGGLVERGSVARQADGSIRFKVADHRSDATVVYSGDLPDLFREGQGVIAEGAFQPTGVFKATQILAKHDERYMPPEVARALKARGEWRPEAAPGPGE
ncbi:MAG TPA: cytochrome c maturation protein CcmE [Caulobacteraceae bacterium]|jgi:cytochrome c-type biogenesis protein CcmE|nr:cytochrome c maturation protein CcmE [Caulobacteraceae bacterium]